MSSCNSVRAPRSAPRLSSDHTVDECLDADDLNQRQTIDGSLQSVPGTGHKVRHRSLRQPYPQDVQYTSKIPRMGGAR